LLAFHRESSFLATVKKASPYLFLTIFSISSHIVKHTGKHSPWTNDIDLFKKKKKEWMRVV
jgi:hypothetical protein